MITDKTCQPDEFRNYFYLKLAPELNRYEKERKKRLITAVILTFIELILLLLLIYFTITYPLHDNRLVSLEWLAVIILLSLLIFTWVFIENNFEKEIKRNIMKSVCNCIGNIKWKKERYSGKSLFSIANLVPEYTDAYFDDIFYGKYKDVEYEIIETTLRRNKRGKLSKTMFTGGIVKLALNKRFKGNTVICPDSFSHKSPFENLKYTELEDIVFEKKFDVFTDDEVEARYLITPAFMERLNTMKTAFSAQKVSCSFYDENLFIGLYTEADLFSIGSLLQPINEEKQFLALFEEILSVIKLIDHFKLDKQIGL